MGHSQRTATATVTAETQSVRRMVRYDPPRHRLIHESCVSSSYSTRHSKLRHPAPRRRDRSTDAEWGLVTRDNPARTHWSVPQLVTVTPTFPAFGDAQQRCSNMSRWIPSVDFHSEGRMLVGCGCGVETVGCCLFGRSVGEPLDGPGVPSRERDRFAPQQATGSLLVQAPPSLAAPMPRRPSCISPRRGSRRVGVDARADRTLSRR